MLNPNSRKTRNKKNLQDLKIYVKEILFLEKLTVFIVMLKNHKLVINLI